MKNLKLTIRRPALYAEVARTTSYMGAKQAPEVNPGDHFDRMAVIDADHTLLDRFANEAVSALAERLKGIVTATDLSSEDISVSLSLSKSYDDSLSASVEGNFEAYMRAAVTSRWLRIVSPGKETSWLTEPERLASEIISALYHRNPPKRH